MDAVKRRRPVYSKLKAFFIEHNIKQEEVAELIKVTRTTFNQKLNGLGADFTLEEARTICGKYYLKMDEYFYFNDGVSHTIQRNDVK